MSSIYVLIMLLSCPLLLVSGTYRDMEVLDPRIRGLSGRRGGEEDKGEGEGKERGGGWWVVDMHWLSHGIINIDDDKMEEDGISSMRGRGGLKVQIDFGYSLVEWKVTEEIDGCDGGGSSRMSSSLVEGEDDELKEKSYEDNPARCINVEYVVDRVGKLFLLDEDKATSDKAYIDNVVEEVCKVELLEDDACGHLRDFVMNGARQVRKGGGDGGWEGVDMIAVVCGKEVGRWGWPFVEVFDVEGERISESCQGGEEKGWHVEVEIVISSSEIGWGGVPGYNPGVGVGEDTRSVTKFVHGGCRNEVGVCDGVQIVKPSEGDTVRRRFSVSVTGSSVSWYVDGVEGGGEGTYWTVLEKGKGGRTRIEAWKDGCRCRWREFEVKEDYKIVGEGEAEMVRRIVEDHHGGVVSIEAGYEVTVGVNGEGNLGKEEGRRVDRVEVMTMPEDLKGGLTIVTACSQEYVDDGRLGNLIGSIDAWEKGTDVLFYDLGVEDWVKDKLESLGVEVVELPETYTLGDGLFIETENHFKDASTYAFKPLCIWDALMGKGRENVLWVDAGAEIRRRLAGVRERMRENGQFLIRHEGSFPDVKYHHPDTVENVGCIPSEITMPHCATTFVGVIRGSYMEGVVKDMLLCAKDNKGCLNPEGSNRGNHRQEQTAMNAVFCRDGRVDMCWDDGEGKWDGSTEFVNDRKEGEMGKVETDKMEWNHVELYTRRVHPVKPYQAF